MSLVEETEENVELEEEEPAEDVVDDAEAEEADNEEEVVEEDAEVADGDVDTEEANQNEVAEVDPESLEGADADPEAPPEEEAEASPEDVELNIRDEDQGRPLSSRSQKSVSFADDVPAADGKKSGGGGGLGHFIRGMWASKEMLDEDTDAQIVMKTTLRELIIYW